MQRADVLMVNNSLDQLGDTFVKNRALAEAQKRGDEQLGLERQRISVDDAFRKEQLARLARMEQHQDEANTARETRDEAAKGREEDRYKLLEKKIGLTQAAEDFAEAQKSLSDSIESVANGAKSGNIDNETATGYFRKSMDAMAAKNPDLHDKLLALPKYQMLYDGKRDWATVADEIRDAKPAVISAQSRETVAKTAADSREAVQDKRGASAENVADIGAGAKRDVANIGAGSRTNVAGMQISAREAAAARRATEGFQTTTVKPVYDLMGKPTGGMSTNVATRVPISGTAPAPAAPQENLPVAPANVSERKHGVKYDTNKGPRWWYNDGTNAGWTRQPPQQQVPGFSTAQPIL